MQETLIDACVAGVDVPASDGLKTLQNMTAADRK